MDENSAPPAGEVSEEDQTVIYLYKKTSDKTPNRGSSGGRRGGGGAVSGPSKSCTGNVDVTYVTVDGKTLREVMDVKRNAPIGERYTTDERHFDGYRFVRMHKDSDPRNGEVKIRDQHVIYVYEKTDQPTTPREEPSKDPTPKAPKPVDPTPSQEPAKAAPAPHRASTKSTPATGKTIPKTGLPLAPLAAPLLLLGGFSLLRRRDDA